MSPMLWVEANAPLGKDNEPRAEDAEDAKVKKRGNYSKTSILRCCSPLRPPRPLREALFLLWLQLRRAG
jgi:hypothetical protein